MGAPMLAVIHTNAKQPHQVRQALQFADGFARHGITYTVTPQADMAGDIHVCLGPNYALCHWQHHPRTILLDRCFYGGENTHVSLGWTRTEGGRRFPDGDDSRWQAIGQELAPLRATASSAIFLDDYGGDSHRATAVIRELRTLHRMVGYRGHPRQEPWPACPAQRWDAPDKSLEAALDSHDTAAGYLTSALVVAGLRGLRLIALHPGSIAARWRADDRQAWAHAVAWANWAETEIGTGDAIAWLMATEQEPADPAAAC
jgi:hypothetical protein